MGQKPHTLLSPGNTAQICILMTLACFCLWLDQNPFSLPVFEDCPAFSMLHKSTYNTPCFQGKCWQGILNLSAFLFCLLNCFCRLFRCFKLNLTAKICSQQYPDVTWTNHFLLCVFFWHYRLQHSTDAALSCNCTLHINMFPQQRLQNHPCKQNKALLFHITLNYNFLWNMLSGLGARKQSGTLNLISSFFCVYFIPFPCQISVLPIPAGTDPFNSRGMHFRGDQQ